MKKIIIIFTILILLVLIVIGLIWGTNSIVVTKIQYTNSKIPSEFNGYKILQISDLHNKEFGKNQSKLVEKVKECNPDIIVITGDLIDRKITDLDNAMEFIEAIVDDIPIYYVCGNHEAYTLEYGKIKEKLIMANVIVLDNESVKLSKDGKTINLIGLIDPNFYTKDDKIKKINNELERLSNDEYFQILLAHRPEFMNIYKRYDIDIALTGHTHGGQIRLPFIGGIVAPNQGFFPTYIDGEYVEGNTTMIVSRGLGNTGVPIRIFNRPEIILLELQKD